MKEINMEGMRLIHSGEDWPHARPPCAKDMAGFLEHNEKIVSWVQPVAGTIEDQIPVVRFHGAYYRLSLRMMKSVWRHIRLKKGFVNREAAPYGGFKLRIPRLLFLEKKRTQARFNVMRMDSSSAAVLKDRKQVQNASNKISCVVHRVLIPLLDAPIPPHVSFRPESTADRGRDLFEHLRAAEPCSVKDRASFVSRMESLYDESFVLTPALTPGSPAASAASPACPG